MEFIDFVDGGEDGLISDNFFGRIYSEIDSAFELHKVGFVAGKHHQVLDFFLVIDVEVFARSANLNIIDSGH